MNFNPLHPLTEDEATELAAAALTASTIEMYDTAVRSASVVQRLQEGIRTGTIDGRELLRWAWFFRARIAEQRARTEWELPLAVLAVVLAETAVANVERLLFRSKSTCITHQPDDTSRTRCGWPLEVSRAPAR